VAATEGSIARAAERLGVTQPTVSEQIHQLERALEVPLFERTRSGIRLTGEGRRTFEHTSVMFRAAETLVAALGRRNDDTVTLRIGISLAASRALPPSFLFPLIELNGCVPSVHRAELPDILQALRRRSLDLALVESPPIALDDQKLAVVDLCRPKLVAVARQKTEWAGASIIQYPPPSAFRAAVDAFLAANSLAPQVIACTDDPLLMLDAAARGACIAFVPDGIARDAIDGGLVEEIARLDDAPLTIHAVHHDSSASALVPVAVSKLVVH
jgi:LysR family transcriptional activator of nhaA